MDSIVTAMMAEEEADTAVVEPVAYTLLDTLLPANDRGYFDQAALDALKANPDYDYERDVRQAPNWWDRFWKRIGQWIDEWLRDVGGDELVDYFWDYIWYAVFLVALGLVLYYMRRRMFSTLLGKAAMDTGSVTALEEDLKSDDLPDQLLAAERASEWRRALRLQYLLVLRTLVDEGRITWKPEYTDHDYAYQLKDESERSRFLRLSFIFKWVWYGQADVDRAHYERLSAGFVDFRNKRAA